MTLVFKRCSPITSVWASRWLKNDGDVSVGTGALHMIWLCQRPLLVAPQLFLFIASGCCSGCSTQASTTLLCHAQKHTLSVLYLCKYTTGIK